MLALIQFLNVLLGSEAIGKLFIVGIDWYLKKSQADQESRQLLVSLAMSLRKQGITDIVLSFNSESDGDLAEKKWDEIEKEKNNGSRNK